MIKHPALQLIATDLSARRGNRIIFHGVHLTAEAGKALTVIGPNGTGKTTLLRCLAGLLAPVMGAVRLEGADHEKSVGEQCHYIGHLNGIKSALSVEDNLTFFADFLGGTSQDIQHAAERLHLGDLLDIPAGYLSAGQKRRLGLARLLCAPRVVWLLDEPAVSLDKASQAILGGVVAEHLAGGGIVIAVTHMPLGWSEAAIFDFSEMGKHSDDGAAQVMSGEDMFL